MGYFNVEGADAKTGKDRVVTILATDQQDAERQAKALGLLVASVYPAIAADAPPPSLGAVAAPPLPAIPDYGGLKIAGSIFSLEAGLCYIASAVSLVVGIVALIFALIKGDDAAREVSISLLMTALIAFVSGGLAHGISASFTALRDIARNSFK